MLIKVQRLVDNIKLDNMELKYKKWDDISIKLFREIEELINENMYVEDQEIKFMSLLCDCDEEEILELPITEFQRLKKECAFLNTQPQMLDKCPDNIVINKQKCVVVKNLKKLTAAQYIDFQQMAKSDINEFLPNLIACFVLPEGKKYGNGYNIDEFAEELNNNLSIVTALSMFDFFQKAFLSSIKDIGLCLDWELRKIGRKAKKEEKMKIQEMRKTLKELTLEKNGVGLVALIQSLKP